MINAELYYLTVNGLSQEPIEYLIEHSARKMFVIDSMRTIRKAYEYGLTQEQIQIAADVEDSYTQSSIYDFLRANGKRGIYIAQILTETDETMSYAVINAYNDHKIQEQDVKPIVQAIHRIRDWN